MSRHASIDIGTNSVLLLVAERGAEGAFRAVEERAEITRLGRGVDATGQLGEAGMKATAEVVETFVRRARELGAQGVVMTATSAARDASNGPAFLERLEAVTGVRPEVLSGDDEARLTFASAVADFRGAHALAAIDIGGGSTEVIVEDVAGHPLFRHSFQCGAVRMTERHLPDDPPSPQQLAALQAALVTTFAPVPRLPMPGRAVGIAGTVTTLCAVLHEVEPYDSSRIHGQRLSREALDGLLRRLTRMPTAERAGLRGLPARRADVILAGGFILAATMDALGVAEVTVSDRGLRWGVLEERFGAVTDLR